MGRPSFDPEGYAWTGRAMARRQAYANSMHAAGVQERKLANKSKDEADRRRRQDEEKKLANVGAQFSRELHERLKSGIVRVGGAGPGKVPSLWKALDPWRALHILQRTLHTGDPALIAIHPAPQDAAHLAKVLRAPGAGGLYPEVFPALERLEGLAEAPAPVALGFRISSCDFCNALHLVETDEAYVPSRIGRSRFNPPKVTDGTIYSIVSRVKDPKRIEAAAILRKVVIRSGHPQIHLSRDEAILLAEVLTTLGGSRGLIASINHIVRREPATAAA